MRSLKIELDVHSTFTYNLISFRISYSTPVVSALASLEKNKSKVVKEKDNKDNNKTFGLGEVEQREIIIPIPGMSESSMMNEQEGGQVGEDNDHREVSIDKKERKKKKKEKAPLPTAEAIEALIEYDD